MTTKARTTSKTTKTAKTAKAAKPAPEEEKEMENPATFLPPPPAEDQDRSGYEDSWYRSLRAIADRRHPEGDEAPEVPED